ncbi:hypothetical protein JNB_16143 [Janibacter sp. HTCC2649]|nr:hypothetical protein JNB_16143 [Janibacter sp. HTCC2649]
MVVVAHDSCILCDSLAAMGQDECADWFQGFGR